MRLFVLALAAAAALSLGFAPHGTSATTSSSVAAENSLPGTDESVWGVEGAGDSTIQGYATDMSVNLGGTIGFKVNAPSGVRYAIDIYRLGWYGGSGARFITELGPLIGQAQPQCLTDTTTGLVDCGNWSVSTNWQVPTTAVSGVYIARLQRTDTLGASEIVFVVRNDASHSAILYQTSDETWQAYNRYGGNSLYTGTHTALGLPDGRAYKVSYNRPFTTRNYEPASFVFGPEFSMIRFLERNGYDVSYTSEVDAARNGSLLLGHKAFLAVGHDEYWSAEQRANVTAARDAGVNLAFFSGNAMFWKTRWENSIDGSNTAWRTLVCYKESAAGTKIDPLPNVWTGDWRDARFSPPADGGVPENGLSGTLYETSFRNDPITVPSTDAGLRFWRNTAVARLQSGQTATLPAGVLGYEWDIDADNGFRPAGEFDMSSSTFDVNTVFDNGGNPGTLTHSLTEYKAPSGALVFSAGTIQWAYGLDGTHDNTTGTIVATDPTMQQATINVLADMGAEPTSLMSGMVAASPSSDTTPPTSTVTSPSAGTTLTAATPVTITGTAADSGGGVVAGVEVSTNGGHSWHEASGRSSWSYTFTPEATGAADVHSRAVDDSGNIEQVAPESCPCTIWPQTSAPSTPSVSDANPIEVGVKLRSDTAGYILGIRFYKGPGNTGAHVAHLWTSSGQLLGTATFTNESASGWQEADFSKPVQIQANTTYVASYFAPNGDYALDRPYFTPTGAGNSPLHALADGVDGANGVYFQGSSGFPTGSFDASNYWVDAVYSQTAVDRTPPTVTGTTPTDGATGVAAGAAPAVHFSEAIAQSTLTSSTLQLQRSGSPIAATISWDPTTNTATLTPALPLPLSTTFTVVAVGGTGGITDMAGNALASTVTSMFSTGTPVACPCTLFPSTATPQTASVADGGSYELGMRFTSDEDGYASGVSFYKGPGNTGTHIGHLWTSSGTLLGSVTFSGETAGGWQQATFAAPIAVQANTTYVVSYSDPNGGFSLDRPYFVAGADAPPLHTPADTATVGNGVYATGAGTFPTQGFNGSNYWVDVVFDTVAVDRTPPTVLSTTPATGVSAVAASIPVSVKFSEPMAPATINSTTFSLRDASGNAVAATVAYDSATSTATLTPSAPLPLGATYTAKVAGATDVAGNALASSYSWAFSTGTPQACPCSLFAPIATPQQASVADTNSYELAVKFVSDEPGYVSGIRFYKGPANTGTHTGTLWTANGVQLATVTFTNETAGGWQQADFSTPVAISANTVYVAGYSDPNGGYALNRPGFTGWLDAPPLHALADGVAGGDGVFGPPGGLPTFSFDASNYWVDLVFTKGAPTVTATSPVAGATNVARGSGATATFSEPVDPATLTSSSFALTGPGGAVAGSVTYDPTTDTATLTPAAPLKGNGGYTATLSTSVQSVEHVPLAAPYSWSFTIADTTPALTPPANQTAREGTSAVFTLGSFADPDVNDGPWAAGVDWGDGTAPGSFSATAPGSLGSLGHTYAMPGTYTVTETVTDKYGLSATKTFSVGTANVAPSLTRPADQSASEGSPATFQLGSFADPGVNDGPWTVGVDWGDGSAGTTFGASAPGLLTGQSHTYATPGTYTVTVTVTDALEGSAGSTFHVSVANVAPSVTPPDNQSANEGSSISYALGSFADPGVNDGPWPVSVDWGDGTTDTFTAQTRGALGTRTHAYAVPGTKTVTVAVTDARGLSGSQTFTVAVQNVAPTVTAAANQSSSEGSPGTFDLGSFTDPGAYDGPWSVDVNWGDTSMHTTFSATARGPLGTQQHTYLTAGTYTATVTLSDKFGTSDAKSFVVGVGNVAPTVAITGADATAQEGSAIVLGSIATDPGVGETLTYSWNVTKNNIVVTTGSGTSISFVPDDNGTFSATLTVTDGKGGSSFDTKSITVLNVAPTATAMNNGPVNEGSAATITASAPFDPSSKDTSAGFRYVFSCEGKPAQAAYAGGTTGPGTSASCTYDDGTSDHTAWVEIVDKDGGYSFTSTPVHVLDVPPAATFAPPMSEPEGSPFSLSLGAPHDPSAADTASLSYTFDCGVGYGLPQLLPSTNCNGLASGTYTVKGKVSVTDASTEYTSNLTVTNVPPTPSIAGAPSSSPEGTPISLTGSATDPGGPNDVKTYVWSVTKNNAAWGPTSATPAFGFTPDDDGTYVVTLTATDAAGAVGTVTKTISVANVAPVPSITNPPATGTEGTPITVNGTANDVSTVDAVTLTKSWSVTRNGNPFTTGSGDSVTFTPLTGTYVVTLTATDKNGGAGSTNTTIAVGNVAPSPSIDNAPVSSPEGTSISLNSAPHDPGASLGDTYTYSWSVQKGGSTYGATGANPGYSFTPTDNGSYDVTLTVKDADGGSSTVTKTITVTNVAPTATLSNNGAVNEGSAATITFTGAADASSVDAGSLHFDITCDGSAPSTSYATTSTSASKTCMFDDGPSSPIVKGAVIDKDGGYALYSTTVQVNNVAPSATFNAPTSVNEGSSIVLSLTGATDVSATDKAVGFSYAFDCGTGAGYGTWGSSPTLSCPTTDNGSRAVKGEIKDKNGGVSEYAATVAINNVAPTATLTAPESVSEGTAITVSLASAMDPSSADTAAGLVYAFDCGSGYATFSGTTSAGCPTNDNGTVTVRAQIKDKDGGTSEYTKSVTVTNVAPSGNWLATAGATVGVPLTLSWGAVADPSSVDMTSGLHYAYNCAGAAVTATYAAAGTSSSVSCTFPTAGTATVGARVIDKDGGYTDYTTNVTVAAPPPTTAFTSGSAAIPSGTASGTTFTYSGSITNGDAATTVAADCGTLAIVSGSLAYTTDATGKHNGFSFKCAFVYTTPTAYTLHATATRGSATGPTATMTVTITAAPPVVTISSPAATWIGSRGSTLTVVSSFTDAGGAANGPYTCTIDWGDGSAKTVLTIASPGSCTSSHMYVAAASLLTVTVTDKYGVSASATRALRVI